VWAFRAFLVLVLALILLVARAGLDARPAAPSPINPTVLALGTELAQPATPSATLVGPRPTGSPQPTRATLSGTIIYAARHAANSHLWAIAQGDPDPIPLTSGSFDDREPAVSPDGRQVAFASDRQGGWDLYILDLATGEVRRITETPAFEGRPTWSPDGLWLAYESYDGRDLDIFVRPVDSSQPPIQLTNAPSMDASPSWDPGPYPPGCQECGRGRRIAFISDRDGLPDVFVANLDDPNERYLNLTQTPLVAEVDPVFSPDGSAIAYSGRGDGLDMIYVVPLDGSSPPHQIGPGRNPAWSTDGDAIGATLPSAQSGRFVLYPLVESDVVSAGFPAIQGIQDLTWAAGGLDQSPSWIPAAPTETPPASLVAGPEGRFGLARLTGVQAPVAMLSDAVAGSFQQLKVRAAQDIGWDVLATLDNAFVGINSPLPPGFAYNDWLYTGRAFAIDPRALASGLVEVVREDFGAETYWRVYVKASPQDGSLGEPLRVRTWDFTTRYTGDPTTYDRGGSLKSSLPEGYYVDLTQLAADFGFERVPAMPNWRTYFQGARYNEFARTDGLTWLQAMLQVYPPEAIVTPTPYHTPTPTPTRTPSLTPTRWYWRWILTATALAQPSATATATPSP
jgi:TolB protein